jgi:hypothetical protein
MSTTPYLLQDLTPDQRLRVLSLDYATSTGFVQPEHWLNAASAIEIYLKTGVCEKKDAQVHQFPMSLEE